jgi:hypothetical protein
MAKKEEKITLPTETFKADGKEYRFIVAVFNLDGKIVTAKEALANKEILAELVDIKAGVIEVVKEKEKEA